VSITVSPLYAVLTINRREYYFRRKTGKFDGTATIEHVGPILIYDASKKIAKTCVADGEAE